MVRINGEEELHLEGKTLKEYLEEKGYRMERIAVERNGEIIPKTSYQDIILQDGDVVESRYAVVRRNRTIHSRMREYLWALKHMDGLETIVLPIGDGMTVSVKA